MRWNRPLSTTLVLLALVIYSTENVYRADDDSSSTTTETPITSTAVDGGSGGYSDDSSSSTTETPITSTDSSGGSDDDDDDDDDGFDGEPSSSTTESTPAAEETTTEAADQTDSNGGVDTTTEDSGNVSSETPSTENPTDTPAPTGAVQVDTTTTEDTNGGNGNGAGVGGPGAIQSVITTSTDNAPTDPTTIDDTNIQTSTAQAVVYTGTPTNNGTQGQRRSQGQQTGKSYTVIPLADDVKVDLPQPTKVTYKDAEGNPVELEDLTDDFQIISADGQGIPNNMVANKHGVYILSPVQTKKNSVIYDPNTIGEALGYLYEVGIELNEFGPKGPAGGWTIDLVHNKQPPQKFKRANGQKTRRATLVFTKKAEVVAEEKYWKQFISSI
ncbi:Protein CBG13648 [Caenorhabditis briggsae]|uniref:Protein CBG13648 n=1 Tax=Caenorhabditis briggsae TaxID=6238 RepID=A8XIE1_CAEBR|nr:Protein CBG13648 [Caenorhabditis briggsae]CAP32415.1 Protein CBG13648 [Caenorhabditis briggsae]